MFFSAISIQSEKKPGTAKIKKQKSDLKADA
jgi:hypothetical protein